MKHTVPCGMIPISISQCCGVYMKRKFALWLGHWKPFNIVAAQVGQCFESPWALFGVKYLDHATE